MNVVGWCLKFVAVGKETSPDTEPFCSSAIDQERFFDNEYRV